MTRSFILLAAFGIALAPSLPAMADQAAAPASADMQAKFQQDAEKSCNYDLDHDHFGSYGTMDECISDKSAKLEHAYIARSATAQAQPATQSH